MTSLANIRTSFLEYFRKQQHNVVSSSSLIPHNDPTLMFVNSGMVQFKNVFTGEEKLPFTRATTCQKSVRAGGKHNDLDNVGYTARHHTFFEMLGNFSFGDYFKEQAIFFAWEYLTKELAIDKKRLYVTHYHTDHQAKEYWQKIAGLPAERIISIDTKDNFWSMGDTGPCGPCSEIFYDHGEHIWGGLPGTPEQDGDRFMEIWNLVFMQFEQQPGGNQVPLPKPSIDTGAGLERLATVMQNVTDNYDVDLFRHIIDAISDNLKVKVTSENKSSFKVIADHLRSVSFLIADGILPSNEGRGYVLRRIMRRAMRYAHSLGCKEPVIYKLVPSLVNEMGDAYPELVRASKLINETIINEEVRFRTTLDKGLKLLDEEIPKINNSTLSGAIAFKLYDTYGFPLDLTVDILRKQDIAVDQDAFAQEMQQQKLRAKSAWAGSGETATAEIWFDLYQKHGATEFLGYELTEVEAIVKAIIPVDKDTSYVLFNQTPFYAESGGQMGDKGSIVNKKGQSFAVIDTKKFLGHLHAHLVKNSQLQEGEQVRLVIDKDYRQKLRSNHSATHLLHKVLREVLGDHVTQKGSLVASDKLRFDFSHMQALSHEQLVVVENKVNDLIRNNHQVHTKISDLQDAITQGAMALFGEKYDSEVRVVTMGESVELCGGTHVKAVGDIGMFKITSEGAIASGVRRIEAITGQVAIDFMRAQEQILLEIANNLKVPTTEICNKINQLQQERKLLDQEKTNFIRKLLIADSNLMSQEKIENLELLTIRDSSIDPKILRQLVEEFKQKPSKLIIAVSNFEQKSSIIIACSSDLNLDAGELIKTFMAKANGKGGGGRKDLAQGGGYDFAKTDQAISAIKNFVSSIPIL